MQIFESRGIRSDEVMPWARSWFERYQINDGGYNCAEEVYLRDTPRSSIVSTVPMLEALLKLSDRGLSDAEDCLLQRLLGVPLRTDLAIAFSNFASSCHLLILVYEF